MRGYFGIGVERVSKAMNVGNLFRTAHAFDASFVFTVDAAYAKREVNKADTSKGTGHLPFYAFPHLNDLVLPQGCQLVGIELMEGAHELPSFRHPQQAAYVLGPERGSLSKQMVQRCDHLIQIPAKFCVNVGIAGAVVMYDRMLSMGSFAERPVRAGGPTEAKREHVHGGPILRTLDPYRDTPPSDYND